MYGRCRIKFLDVGWFLVGGSPPHCKRQVRRGTGARVLSALGWFRLSCTPRRMLRWVVDYVLGSVSEPGKSLARKTDGQGCPPAGSSVANGELFEKPKFPLSVCVQRADFVSNCRVLKVTRKITRISLWLIRKILLSRNILWIVEMLFIILFACR